MEESQKMSALKRAYADIILNTAKEAADRILASERKARRFQQDLIAAKEEALNALLRLKHVMDSKVVEAERVCVDQKRRVQELETKLNEAERTVKDLREELKGVHGELEIMKHNLVGHSREKTLKEQKKVHIVRYDSALENQKCANSKHCFVTETPAAQSEPELNNPDLASIIMISKEPDSLRNGCTQRIRAFGQNVLMGTRSLSKTNEPVAVEETAKQTCRAGAPMVGMANADENLIDLKYDKGQFKFFQRSSSRRPRGRCKYSKISNIEEKPSVQSGRDTSEGQDSHFVPVSTKTEDSKGQSCILPEDKKPAEENHENLMEVPKVEGTSVCQVKQEITSSLVDKGESKDGKTCEKNVIPSQALNNGHLKYTFHRKRKREHLSIHRDEVVVEKTSSPKTRGTNKQNAQPVLAMESSRDSRRLVQVARQLISLSEKQWR